MPTNRDIRHSEAYRQFEDWILEAEQSQFGRPSWPSDPVPDSTGARLAFVARRFDSLESAPASLVCVVDVTDGSIIQVGYGEQDSHPRWTPDGRWLLFLSSHASPTGGPQLCLANADNLTDVRHGPTVDGAVEAFDVAADGRRVLMIVAPPGADIGGGQGSGRYEAEGLPPWVPDIRVGQEPRRRCHVADLTSNEVQVVSPANLNVWEASWSGDAAIAAIVSESGGESAWYESELVSIDPETTRATLVYRSDDAQLALPTGIDGLTAVVEGVCSDRGLVAGEILVFQGGESDAPRRVDTHGVDVSAMTWRRPDSLSYAGLRGLDTVAGEYDTSSGQAAELWSSSETFGGGWSPTAVRPDVSGRLFAVLESYDRYPELVMIDAGSVRALATFDHPGVAKVRERSGSLDTISWRASDGLEIQGLLVLPDAPGPHPLILNIHGGPITAWRNRWGIANGFRYPYVGFLASQGFATLYVNPRGSSGRGRTFASLVRGDLTGDDTNDLLSGIDHLVETGIADPKRIGVTGNSYGGLMSCWLVTQTDRFAAAVATSPISDHVSQYYASNIAKFMEIFLGPDPLAADGPYRSRSPLLHAGRARTPTMLVAGLRDRCTPADQAVEFHQALCENGVPSELVLYPRQGHGVEGFPETIDFVARMVIWFNRHMPAT